MDRKAKSGLKNEPKKKLIRTKRETNRIKIIVTVSVLLVAAILYYFIDSGSYVATVDGRRISKAEYQFFLAQQQSATEQKEGIYYETDENKEAFWKKVVDGQNLWEDAKRETLDATKEYMIQLIKAEEMGLKVDSKIKSEVANLLESTKSSMGMTNRNFVDYIEFFYKINPDQLQKVSENLMLIDKFRESYLSNNYKPEEITDKDVQNYYENDPKQFDTVDIRYVYLSKVDEDGKALPQDEIDAKKSVAREVLEKIKTGEDMDKIVPEYTEEEATSGSDKPAGSTSVTYFEGSDLLDWIFANKLGDADIVEMDDDIFIVKIEDRSSFEDVKATVKTRIENEAEENFYNKALSDWSLEAKYNIIKNNGVYDSFSFK